MVKLGAPYPTSLLGKDPLALKDYFQAIEDMGYSYVSCGDHVLGADRSTRPNWAPYFGKPPLFDYKNAFHEPFVLFGYLASITKKVEFVTGILILGQRQTALVAKQAAEVDYLSNGRMRIVAAVGWNDVEYESLGVPFAGRGARVEEQKKLMRLFWTQVVVTFHGKFHTINAAGINPLPVQRPIPLWVGGASKPVLERAGRIGDGWYPAYPFFNPDVIAKDIETIRASAKAAGRDPAKLGVQGMAFFDDMRFERIPGDRLAPKNIDEGVPEAHAWKKLGATHYSASGLPPGQPGETQAAMLQRMLSALHKFKTTVGKDF